MHALLVQRAALAACTEESQEERDLASITDLIEAYESVPLAERQGRRGQRLGE